LVPDEEQGDTSVGEEAALEQTEARAAKAEERRREAAEQAADSAAAAAQGADKEDVVMEVVERGRRSTPTELLESTHTWSRWCAERWWVVRA
jgi:hypothetical protein